MSSRQEDEEPAQATAPAPEEVAAPVESAPTDVPPAPHRSPSDDGVASAEPAVPSPPSAAPADTDAATAEAPMTGAEAKRQSALAALMKVLDSSDDDHDATTTTASMRSVQKMCMRLPQLSEELTRPQRYRLYTLLLLGDDAKAPLPASWTAYAEKALETHIAVAEQAVALFPESLQITVQDLAGLFYHLGAETAFYFNPEMVDVILCVAYVVAGARSTDKAVLLGSLYQMLYVLQKDFLVSTSSRLYEPATTSLLRLMLQFFDPALATHMDQQQVEIGTYVLEWTRRLLVLQSDVETALKVLDWVFILGDPVMTPYVALAYLITHRQHLLSLHTKAELASCLATMKLTLPATKAEAVDPKLVDGRATALMPVWSGKSLLQNADLLYRVTPLSTQRMLDFCLYPDVGTLNKTPEDLQQYYANTPCLPLERSDLASAFAKRAPTGGQEGEGAETAMLPSREYVIVDCRSKASFEYVRLPTAVLVGDVLSYQQDELEVAMQRLESCRGRSLALFGTGRPIVEEVNLLKVLALYLINKKAFPFVCIVPGGFKTTIPLLRNRVIEAVLCPAAAASLDAAAKSTGTDWGQQASNTAHNLSAKLSEFSGMLPHVEAAEVRQKAEELGSKAKESVAAAGTWGWGMMQRLRDTLGETREQASTALSSVTTKLNAASAPATTSVPAGEANRPSATQAATSAPPPQPPQQQQASQQIFSLGDEGEEEDLDLITSIPTRPMRGTVVETPQQQQLAANAPQLPVASVVTEMKAAAVVANPSTPERRPPTPTAVMEAATPLAKEETSIDASPAPVPPPRSDKSAVALASPPTTAAAAAPSPSAAATTAAAVPRGASASQIAANIDAEFDELFGDLNTSPLPATRVSASPAKASAAVTQDDLFGE